MVMKNVDQDKEHALLYSHIREIRSRPWGETCRIVVIIEGNLSQIMAYNTASYIVNQLPAGAGRVEVLLTTIAGDTRPFVWLRGAKDHNKEDLSNRFKNYLSRNDVYLYSDFFSAHLSEKGTAEVVEELQNQLKRFRLKNIEAANEDAPGKSVISGKGGGHQDDFTMALLVGSYWAAAHEYDAADVGHPPPPPPPSRPPARSSSSLRTPLLRRRLRRNTRGRHSGTSWIIVRKTCFYLSRALSVEQLVGSASSARFKRVPAGHGVRDLLRLLCLGHGQVQYGTDQGTDKLDRAVL